MTAADVEEVVDLDIDLGIEPVCEIDSSLTDYSVDTGCLCDRPAAWVNGCRGSGIAKLSCEEHYRDFMSWTGTWGCLRCGQEPAPRGHWTWRKL